MEISLIHYTPLEVTVKAIRTCWQSQDKSDNMGEKDIALIDRVANKNKHASTIEHLNYTFDIDGISRACLQELARHRMASLSVKSTRYTLKELKEAKPFVDYNTNSLLCTLEEASKYIVLTGTKSVDFSSLYSLGLLQQRLQEGVSNDVAKYCLPESYKTSLVWTINARSLQNFLALRTSRAALAEIRDLANEIFNQLPEDHKFLFKEYING